MNRPGLGDDRLPAVFPDWSPYADLESAARAYLRDPDLALEALAEVLPAGRAALSDPASVAAGVLTFTLERFVNETNGVWQEVAVCDGSRLVLWHGEDVTAEDSPGGAMTSSLRVVPLSQVAEVGSRRRIQRRPDGASVVDAIDVYVLLHSLDDGPARTDETGAPPVRQDVLRFVKTIEDGGAGQIARLAEFARIVCALVGRPI
jgi:hypothetical protein